jgi:transposase
MDTSEQTILDEPSKREARRRRSVEEKRRIVEETLEAGASVARVARRHAVNANQVFYWRKKYREGRLGKSRSNKLLPVTLSDLSWSKSGRVGCGSSSSAVGTMEVKLARGQLRVMGNVDAEALRTVLECLRG